MSIVLPGNIGIGFDGDAVSSVYRKFFLKPSTMPLREPHGRFTGLHWDKSEHPYTYPPLIQGGPVITDKNRSEYNPGDIRWISIIEIDSQGNRNLQQTLINKKEGHIPIVNLPGGLKREQFRRNMAEAFRVGSNLSISVLFDDEPYEPLIVYTS